MKEKVVKLVAEIETGIAYPSYLEASFIVKRKGMCRVSSEVG